MQCSAAYNKTDEKESPRKAFASSKRIAALVLLKLFISGNESGSA